MAFGKDSSFVFFMQDGRLVNVGRADVTADKQPFDSVEEEVWRIFGKYKELQAEIKAKDDRIEELQGEVDACKAEVVDLIERIKESQK